MGSIKRKASELEEECVSKIIAVKAILEAHSSSSSEQLLRASSQLRELGQLSTEVLRATQIGRLVNQVAKETSCDEVRQSLAELRDAWKQMFRDSSKVAQIAASEEKLTESPKADLGDASRPLSKSKAGQPLTLELYRQRLSQQKKYFDYKPGTRSVDNCLQDPPTMPPVVTISPKTHPIPQRTSQGHFLFEDFPEFKPNLSPKQVLQAGAFGGTYFRDISSAVTGMHYKGKEVIKEFPEDWFQGLQVDMLVTSQDYRKSVNKYGVSCGGSLGMWETSGWISAVDPYGWFHWYCRFFLGRRSSDDERQVDRWLKGQGPKGRWRLQLMNKILKDRAAFDDAKVSPVIRQVLVHWGYKLTSDDLEAYKTVQFSKK
jgi:hypothetical protein